MPGNSSLLVRGRSVTYVLAGALLVAFLAGAFRPWLLAQAAPLLSGVPWPLLGRFMFGLLVDLPTVVFSWALCAAVRLVFVLRPWLTATGLVLALVGLDLVVAALIGQDFRLWTDPAVVSARGLSHLVLLLVAGLLLRGRWSGPSAPPGDESI